MQTLINIRLSLPSDLVQVPFAGKPHIIARSSNLAAVVN
jgi:hypothetical protein